MAKPEEQIHLDPKYAQEVAACFNEKSIHPFSQFDAQAMVLITRTAKAMLYAVEKEGFIYVAQIALRRNSTDYQVVIFQHDLKPVPTHVESNQMKNHSFSHYDAKCMTLIENTLLDVNAKLYASEKHGVLKLVQVTRRSLFTDIQEISFLLGLKPF